VTSDAQAPFTHELAMCDSDQVGARTKIWAYSHVVAGAIVGDDCKIGEHCYIEDGATLGDRVTVKNGALIWRGVHIDDDVFVGPRATFTNDARPRVEVPVPADELLHTHVGRGATLCASVTVLPGVRIGIHAFVGAASLVTRDVADHAIVFGVPARPMGWVCCCGARLGDNLACSCGRRFELSNDGLIEQPSTAELREDDEAPAR
jgi:UDP-2-acetamido-3-amino-2,3-dideoxy-glucuronate N-acetyltransferase